MSINVCGLELCFINFVIIDIGTVELFCTDVIFCAAFMRCYLDMNVGCAQFVPGIYLYFYNAARVLVDRNIPLGQLKASGISDELIRIKYDVPNDQPELLDAYRGKIDRAISSVLEANAV